MNAFKTINVSIQTGFYENTVCLKGVAEEGKEVTVKFLR